MDNKERDMEAQKLWKSYHDDPTVENNNQLIEHYLYLVKPIVMRMSPLYKATFRDYDDLVSNGVLGLMDAIGKYDPERNVKFETYAQRRIRGAILDYMRQQDWIPINMRKEIKDAKQAYEALSAKLQRAPEYEELAEHMGLSADKVRKIFLNDYQYSLIHFEDVVGGVAYHSEMDMPKGVNMIRDNDESRMPEKNLLETEAKEVLVSLLESLPRDERLVLDLYYRKELKLREIADIMNLTESRISQIHKQAINKITKKYLEEYENLCGQL